MEEIEIKDVNFEGFATLLSFVHLNAIAPTKINAEKVVELADRFLLPSVKHHLEPYLISSNIDVFEKIRIGEKYELEKLLEHGLWNVKKSDYKDLPDKAVYKGFSSETKNKLFYKYLDI